MRLRGDLSSASETEATSTRRNCAINSESVCGATTGEDCAFTSRIPAVAAIKVNIARLMASSSRFRLRAAEPSTSPGYRRLSHRDSTSSIAWFGRAHAVSALSWRNISHPWAIRLRRARRSSANEVWRVWAALNAITLARPLLFLWTGVFVSVSFLLRASGAGRQPAQFRLAGCHGLDGRWQRQGSHHDRCHAVISNRCPTH